MGLLEYLIHTNLSNKHKKLPHNILNLFFLNVIGFCADCLPFLSLQILDNSLVKNICPCPIIYCVLLSSYKRPQVARGTCLGITNLEQAILILEIVIIFIMVG